jgi:hypothetical protein
MARVTGIGGVFFKSRTDRTALAAWYRDHLGVTLNGKFAWILDPDGNKVELWEPMTRADENKRP